MNAFGNHTREGGGFREESYKLSVWISVGIIKINNKNHQKNVPPARAAGGRGGGGATILNNSPIKRREKREEEI